MSHTSMKELYEAEKDWLIERLSWAEQQRDELVGAIRQASTNLDEKDEIIDELLEALTMIANNTCCGDCQEAKRVALQALAKHEGKT